MRTAQLFWATVTGLSEEPSRSAHFAAWEARGRWRHTVLDHRAMFLGLPRVGRCACRRGPVERDGRRRQPLGVRGRAGETDPERAADALLDAGVEVAIVKQGQAEDTA